MLPIDTQHTNGAIISELQQLSQGLLLISESEAPFEIVALSAFPDRPDDMEEVSLDDVLGYAATVQEWHTEEDKAVVARFAALKAAIESHLQNIRVYKTIRGGEKQVWIIGNSQEGVIGIITRVVET
ncbi:MAG: nuclease A inhibitor family protein [Cytophagales bacterium]|nr:nuclease A inhibitor family protein [Bernardetiaceae bacterium]MDW8205786.1 nuclease A inhibitor family protein [Cytophagales bacterium]